MFYKNKKQEMTEIATVAILGPVKDSRSWRKRRNSEIYDLYQDNSVVKSIKIDRIRWLGHLQRMEDLELPKRVPINDTVVINIVTTALLVATDGGEQHTQKRIGVGGRINHNTSSYNLKENLSNCMADNRLPPPVGILPLSPAAPPPASPTRTIIESPLPVPSTPRVVVLHCLPCQRPEKRREYSACQSRYRAASKGVGLEGRGPSDFPSPTNRVLPREVRLRTDAGGSNEEAIQDMGMVWICGQHKFGRYTQGRLPEKRLEQGGSGRRDPYEMNGTHGIRDRTPPGVSSGYRQKHTFSKQQNNFEPSNLRRDNSCRIYSTSSWEVACD
ncbi:hypothetical protein AAG570_003399 [Ranatra chinensis]|uniref:Uncharacterized protein n=1 Tax=Ranatra chinensis TaxID=642074 RepID=A0ABD0Y3H2_9HEMI